MPDLITLSDIGAQTARKLAAALPATTIYVHETVLNKDGAITFSSTATLVEKRFSQTDGMIFIGPCGVMVRAVAPHLQGKFSDPPVVVTDVYGRWAISLLSGHEGGANALCLSVANILGSEPVITTTSDAVKTLIVGVGCRRGCPAETLVEVIRDALDQIGNSPASVRYLASADIKSNEPGLLQAADRLGIPLRLIASEEIQACTREFHLSPLALEKVNLPAVAEPAALMAGRRTTLILPRLKRNGVTVAVARENSSSSGSVPETPLIEPPAPKRPSPKARS